MSNFNICKSNTVLAILIVATSLTEVIVSHQAEVLVNESAFIRCFSKEVKRIQWHHIPHRKKSSNYNEYVYAGGEFKNSYRDGRFRVDNNLTTRMFTLVITNVTHEDAGLYECRDDVLSGVFGSTYLTVLDSSPVCTSNMNPNGFAGPNTCNVEQENMTFSCAVSFSGNSLNLMWSTLTGKQSLSSPICETKDNRINCSLSMKADPSFDGSTFICQTTTSNDARHNCSIENIRVECKAGSMAVPIIVVTVLFVVVIVVVAVIAVIAFLLYTKRIKGRRVLRFVAEHLLRLIENNTPDNPNLHKIKSQRRKLEVIIAPGFGLTDKLCSSNILTFLFKILIHVQETTDDKNKLLLDFILKSGKCDEFVQALRESDQIHVANWIEANGVYSPQFGMDWPLGENELNFLKSNFKELSEVLVTNHEFLQMLLSKKVINAKQMESIMEKSTPSERNEAFLNILNQSSLRAYNLTPKCLRESNQQPVSTLFENGGVIVPVHSTQGGNNVKEVEEYIVNEMGKLCEENQPLLKHIDPNSLLEWLRLRLNAVKEGKSIVLFVSCYNIKEFQHLCAVVDNDELKTSLEKLFNLLLHNMQTEVLLVTIYNFDRKNAENYFQREFLRDKKYDEHFQRLCSQLTHEEPMKVTTEESDEEMEELQKKSERYSSSESAERREYTERRWLRFMKMFDDDYKYFHHESGWPRECAHRLLMELHEILFFTEEDEWRRRLDLPSEPLRTRGFSLMVNREFFKVHIKTLKTIFKLASRVIQTEYKYKELPIVLERYERLSQKESEIMSDINELLIFVIMRFSNKVYWEFIKCLRETDQGVVADVAEKGGVTVKMRITHELIENIAEIENEIVTKLNQLHESASPRSEDLWRLLSQLKIGGVEILSARYDEGIVTWIWCRSNSAIAKLKELNKDKRLGNLFSALFHCLPISPVPKINDVLWENPDVDADTRILYKWLVKTSATMSGQKISEIAMMENKIIIAFQNRSALAIFTFDEEGNAIFERDETFKKIETPMHMASSLNLRCLYITDRSSSTIWKVTFDFEGKLDEPMLWLPGSLTDQINSLSLGKNDNLLVLKEGKPNRLEIYDKLARKLNQLDLPVQIRYPNNAVEASNGDFVISYHSDLTPGGICRINYKGILVSNLDIGFKFLPIQRLSEDENSVASSLSEGIPYLKHFDHFTLDDEDQVYACGADQCVVLLDSELNMEKAIEVKDLKNPYRIHYLNNKKELLLVHGADQDSFSVLTSGLRME